MLKLRENFDVLNPNRQSQVRKPFVERQKLNTLKASTAKEVVGQ